MKKIFAILTAVLLTASVFAQSPEKMSYQAVIRNSSDALVTNQDMGMQISILQGSASGTAVYVETHSTVSNENGLVTLEIGTGTTSDDFSAIDWANDVYFIKTETDPTTAGGTNYTITGTSQLLSVPYALHAKEVENVDYSQITNTPFIPSDISDLTDNGSLLFDGDYNSLTNLPILFDGEWSSLTNTPTTISGYGITDAFSGSYTDLTNKPVNATTTVDGFMSAVDKTKLDGITTPVHTIGESYGGGIIFYLDASGQHGLIAATTDQSSAIQWYNGIYTNTTAFASSVGVGDGNTSMIIFNQGTGTYAAELCRNSNINGFNDWYLPSKYELNLMYNNIGQGDLLGLGNIGGFSYFAYWSSTEISATNAWFQLFGTGSQIGILKFNAFYVRAVRSF